uniref:Uncharacterized protein n=1 Tax=Brassica oleracea var. oleracea TaxID=109376 RepID=A0A0D3E7B2_BRAOL
MLCFKWRPVCEGRFQLGLGIRVRIGCFRFLSFRMERYIIRSGYFILWIASGF